MTLTQLSLDTSVDSVLSSFNSTTTNLKQKISRIDDDLVPVREFLASSSITTKTKKNTTLNGVVSDVIPIYIIMEIEIAAGEYSICGVSMFTLGYSSRKGRIMNLDLFVVTDDDQQQQHGMIFMQSLAKIAKHLDCSRIAYFLNKDDPQVELFRKDFGIEISSTVLTLQMGIEEMWSFVATRTEWAGGNQDMSEQQTDPTKIPIWSFVTTRKEVGGGRQVLTSETQIKPTKTLGIKKRSRYSFNAIEKAMINTLEKLNIAIAQKTQSEAISLKAASRDDVQNIFNLVNGLAVYEKALDQVAVNPSIYKRDGCGGESSIFYTILVESSQGDSSSSAIVGMGLFYFGYSVTLGKYLFLEDLFIQESLRGNGYGKAIMYSLADIALTLNCKNFVWQALDWNSTALAFYDSIGAKVCDLRTIRLDQEKIDQLSA